MKLVKRCILAIAVCGGIAALPAHAQEGQQPGGTPDDMQAMMEAYMKAAEPGKMHKFLTDGVGVWEGQVSMWHVPGMPADESTCTTIITPMLGGRFTKGETRGEMAGMGPFEGFGLYGFDNTSQKFQSVWIDSMGTGIMVGEGELAEDGKTLNWTFTYNCPLDGEPKGLREVQRITGEDTMVLEMYGPSPDDGAEYKLMEIKYTRTSREPWTGRRGPRRSSE